MYAILPGYVDEKGTLPKTTNVAPGFRLIVTRSHHHKIEFLATLFMGNIISKSFSTAKF